MNKLKIKTNEFNQKKSIFISEIKFINKVIIISNFL